ncbi:MAG: hypothetical protein RI897_168 [Verrucomicrobiota bacterium]
MGDGWGYFLGRMTSSAFWRRGISDSETQASLRRSQGMSLVLPSMFLRMTALAGSALAVAPPAMPMARRIVMVWFAGHS